MASKIDWGTVGGDKKGNRGGGDKPLYVEFKPDVPVTIRPIGGAVQFMKVFVNKRSVVLDPENKDQAKALIESSTNQKCEPKMRFAINVIDRSDGKVKILENGPSIFKHFANWSKLNGNAGPGGNSGTDWNILPTGVGLDREYAVMPTVPTPLTPDEIAKAKDPKGLYPLSEIYKCCPVNEIVSRITGTYKKAEGSAPNHAVSNSSVGDQSSDDPTNW